MALPPEDHPGPLVPPVKGLVTLTGCRTLAQLRPKKEDAMYGGLLILVLALVILLSPAIWFVWWMLADLGEPTNRRPRPV
jgi:hypothetical protein